MGDSRRALREDIGGAVGSPWLRSTWVGYAAAGWSLVYGVLGLHWARGGAGFPFGRDSDPDARCRGVGSGGCARRERRTRHRRPGAGGRAGGRGVDPIPGSCTDAARLATGRLGDAGMLLVVVPDRHLVLSAAYAPIVLLRLRMGWSLAGSRNHPTGATLVYQNGTIPWPVLNQFLLVAGGLLWPGPRSPPRMAMPPSPARTAPQAAASWGRWGAHGGRRSTAVRRHAVGVGPPSARSRT